MDKIHIKEISNGYMVMQERKKTAEGTGMGGWCDAMEYEEYFAKTPEQAASVVLRLITNQVKA